MNVIPRNIKSIVGTSEVNTELTVTKGKVSGKKNYCAGFEVVVTGAATGAVVDISLKQGTTEVWATAIPSGSEIGSTKSFFPCVPLEFDEDTDINLVVDAGGANCIMKASLLVFTGV
jgi:hypothetical protein